MGILVFERAILMGVMGGFFFYSLSKAEHLGHESQI